MQTNYDFKKFIGLYNYEFGDEIEDFKRSNSMSKVDVNMLEVRVYDSGNDVVVSLHYFVGYDSSFKYANTDGYVEVCEVDMPDEENKAFVREIVQQAS